MHNATAITTGSANQRPNTPCIRLWIDVTFRGLEDSYTLSFCHGHSWRVRLAKQETLRAPGLTSGLQGSVNVHRGALVLVSQ